MARVPLDYEIRTGPGPVVPGIRLYIYDRGTTNETSVYDDDTSGSVIDQPLLSDGEGRFPDSWVVGGSYDRYSPDDTVEPTQPWEAVVGVDAADVAIMREATLNLMDPRWENVGDGTANDTVGVQEALDYAESIGGARVVAPPDKVFMWDQVVVGDNVTLGGFGWGVSKVLANPATAANTTFINLSGDNSAVEDLEVDVNDRPGSIGILVWRDEVATTIIDSARVRRCHIRNTDRRDACRCSRPTLDFQFEDNLVEDCCQAISGASISTFTMYGTTDALTTGARIRRNRFRGCGGVNIQVFSDSAANGTARTFQDVEISHNDLRDFLSPALAIPIEPTGVHGLKVLFNTIPTLCTRGVSMGNNTDSLCLGNTIKNQTIYAFEMNKGIDYKLIANTTEDCASFAKQSDVTGAIDGLLIASNTYKGTGLSALVANSYAIYLQSATNVQITDNTFDDWEYLSGLIRLGTGASNYVEDGAVTDNEFHIRSADTPLEAIVLSFAKRVKVAENNIVIHRALVAGDTYKIPIRQTINATAEKHRIEDNHIFFLADVSAPANSYGIGQGDESAGAVPGTKVKRNEVVGALKGLRFLVNSADLEITDNDTRACTNADTIPATALSRTARVIEAAAAPTTGTWRVGDRVFGTAPAAGGTMGWVCTTAGTPGTWKTFGAIAA